MKKTALKTVSTSRKFVYFILSTLNTVLFGQAPPKPNPKHHLELIDLLMDGSECLKSGSGSGWAKKPGSIRIQIRNTAFFGSSNYNKDPEKRSIYLMREAKVL